MTDRLFENIQKIFKKKMECIVLDNGSDQDKVSKYTTHHIKNNLRMTGGFNQGIEIIQEMDYDNIWFFTNDCYFEDNGICPLESSESFLLEYPEIGILHPSESRSVNVCYDVYQDSSIDGVKLVTEYDIVCPIFTKKAIESMGGKFNPKLYQGWGLDHESSFLVRKAGMVVGINHQIVIGHDTSSTYDQGLDKLHKNRDSYYRSAMNEMYQVFNHQYGLNWYHTFTQTFNESSGKILCKK